MSNNANNQDDIQYFEAEATIYPRIVRGFYRNMKWAIMCVALLVYYLVPWIRYDRGEHAPDQAVLIDMVHARGYFFGLEIWPQEVYYLTAILIVAAIALFLVTSLLGRIWCGYFCFQTIWTDLFISVERWVQGDRNARMRLDKGPWNFKKIWQKTLTHIIWVLIGLCTGGAWVFYFNDAPTLLDQILHLSVPWNVLGWIIALTGSTYVMAGFAREQVCKYMCPYARFQSAMFDDNTLIIGYDYQRGENRGSLKKQQANPEKYGDCVDCTACVQVCPMGIDIRDGLQMECIACGLCIDACDEVMDKVGYDRGLVKYDIFKNFDRLKKIPLKLKTFLRPRTIYYIVILSLVMGKVVYSMLNREATELHILHDRNPVFVMMSDGNIRNGYDVKILNKTHSDQRYSLKLLNLKDGVVRIQGAGKYDPDNLLVFADRVGHFRLFIHAPKQDILRKEVTLTVTNHDTNIVTEYETIFVSGDIK